MVFPDAVGKKGPTPMRAAVLVVVPLPFQVASPPTAGCMPLSALSPLPLTVTTEVDVPAPYQCGP